MIVSSKMQNLAALTVLALCLSLQPCQADDGAGLYIPAARDGAQEVVKLNQNTPYKPGDKQIKTKMSPNSNFETIFACDATNGLQLTPNEGGKYVGCCTADQILVGNEADRFMCCGHKHIMAGNKNVGFSCCPEGSTFDGKMCDPPDPPKPDPPKPTPTPNPNPPKPDPPTCANGKELVHGKCVCPKGTKENEGGQCAPASCESEISYGKCYKMVFNNGLYFGPDAGGTYYAGPNYIDRGSGVFTFCPDENCTATGPVGANDTFFIKDNRGRPRDGNGAGYFLNNYANGNHITSVPDQKPYVSQYGKFSISKFSECGKYCLGGSDDGGLYYACPAPNPALTFWPKDPGQCVPIELVEVSCNQHDPHANCAWGCGCDENKKIACGPSHEEL